VYGKSHACLQVSIEAELYQIDAGLIFVLFYVAAVRFVLIRCISPSSLHFVSYSLANIQIPLKDRIEGIR
jgi:hypothetical protein